MKFTKRSTSKQKTSRNIDLTTSDRAAIRSTRATQVASQRNEGRLGRRRWPELGLLAFGVVLAVVFPANWIVGAVLAFAGVYELFEALTHKSRWINARVKATRENKTVTGRPTNTSDDFFLRDI